MNKYKVSCNDAEFSQKLQSYQINESVTSLSKEKIQEYLGKDAYVTVNEKEKIVTAKRVLKG